MATKYENEGSSRKQFVSNHEGSDTTPKEGRCFMRKVAILGASGPSCRWAEDLPWDIELWGMNLTHRLVKKRPFQRFFQMHHRMHNAGNGHPPGHFGRPLDHEEFLGEFPGPVYMQERDPEIPTSVEYPLREVVGRLGSYLTSTASYMLALALYEQVDEIKLLGIYMQQGTEYEHQRPSIEYLLGAAKGMGIPVTLPDDCPLAKAPLYGYSETTQESVTLQSVYVMN